MHRDDRTMTHSRTSSLPELTQTRDYAPAGFEPPLCVAIGHRMGEIAKTPLTYTANIRVRGHLSPGLAEDSTLGPTVTDLAAGDRAFCHEPTNGYTQRTAQLRR